MTRVLALSNLYPSHAHPTRGLFNHQRFSALARFCEVRVIAPLPWWGRLRRLKELWSAPFETNSSLPALFPTYWSLPGLTWAHGRGMATSLYPHLQQFRQEFPFDLILAAWGYPDAVAAAYLARQFKCPLVTMVLGSDLNEIARYPTLRKQIRWALRQSSQVVAVSEALRDRALELGTDEDRIVVQRNCVDGKRFTIRSKIVARRELKLPETVRIIGYVGNFSPEKGVEVLVEAFCRLRRQETTEVQLCLVGSGSLEPALRARVAEAGLNKAVHFMGKRLYPEIPNWMASADVVCLPSYREGCPNVVLEALASGRPVVASNVGGVPELIHSGKNGLLAPPGDEEALAAELQRALNRKWEPESLRASVEHLSWEQYGRRLFTVIQTVLAEPLLH